MSDGDSWKDPLDAAPEPPAKSKMSGCLLTTIIVGGIGAFSALICCGVFAWFISGLIPKTVTEPAEVAKVSHEIFNTEIIEGFSPDRAFTIENFFMKMQAANFKHKEGKGELLIAKVVIKLGDQNAQMAPDQSKQFREGLEAPIRNRMDSKKTEEHEITVFGTKTNIAVSEGIDREDSKPIHMATFELSQGRNHYFLLIRMEDEVWDQDAVFKMLEDAKPE